MRKICTKCGQEKSISEFGKDRRKSDGHRPVCKCCNREVAKVWETKTQEKRSEQAKTWKASNRERINEATFLWRKSDTGAISELLSQAKKRAKLAGLPFALTVADIEIPEVCPVFKKTID